MTVRDESTHALPVFHAHSLEAKDTVLYMYKCTASAVWTDCVLFAYTINVLTTKHLDKIQVWCIGVYNLLSPHARRITTSPDLWLYFI